jgi:hypothetical protein
MSKLNAPYLYLNAIKRIVDTPTTSNEKPSKFSGGGLMGNGSGEDTKEQPYYEPHLQALLQVAKMRKEVNDG